MTRLDESQFDVALGVPGVHPTLPFIIIEPGDSGPAPADGVSGILAESGEHILGEGGGGILPES